MSRRLNHEPDTILELKESAPGMWGFPKNPEHRCIYRVPHRLRRVNPEAYTPQLLLIGPLHHSLKFQALDSRGDITNTKLMGYLNMEEQKKIYLASFSKRLRKEDIIKKTIEEFERIIKEDEDIIRASYSESTAWIESPKFVDMILHDSVFILEFLLRSKDYTLHVEKKTDTTKITWDPIFEQPCLQTTVYEDLILLENQIPYFILEKLFNTIVPRLHSNQRYQRLRDIVITYFRFQGKISSISTFKHFTDLFRCVREETLTSGKRSIPFVVFRFSSDDSDDYLDFPTSTDSDDYSISDDASRSDDANSLCNSPFMGFFLLLLTNLTKKRSDVPQVPQPATRSSEVRPNLPNLIKRMYNAEKLYSAGVNFKAVTDEFSIDVRFENGCLKIPCLWVPDDAEITLRNIMALEQCHYPFEAYVCNFVSFLDFLIDTDKDVDLLMENGILNNWGERSSVAVAEMVNTLSSGVVENCSCYADIASRVNAYYDNPVNRSRAILGRQYFGNIWRGTATVAATLLLVMTLIQTVASIIQVMQK